MDGDMLFGAWVRRRRRALDLSQEALAQQVGCARITIQKIEAGERRPSREFATVLAERLAIPLDERDGFIRAARTGFLDTAPTARHVAALTPAHSARSPLPVPLTPFIGRAEELGALVELLRTAQTHLITIVAPGGMGKTRLALAALECMQADGPFPDGIAATDLAPLTIADHLDTTLAGALDLPLDTGGPARRAPRQQLLDYLRGKRLLLLLDSCEHLRETVAELVSAILTTAPGVTVLVTSRERLGLRAEQLLSLDGMPGATDGAALFTMRARHLQPDFALDAQTLPLVAQICTRLGGMPLAIELAATWVDTLSLPNIIAVLAHGNSLLVSEAPDVPTRQRSVRAVCDASWSRLTAAEQQVFAALGVFLGGGTRAALQAVTGAALPQLQSLVGKALLRYSPQRERYTMHEVLRRYAAERLADSPDAETEARARHADYYLSLLAASEAKLKGAGQMEALGALERDSENVRAAWAWASTRQRVDLVTPATACLCLSYEWQGWIADGVAAMALALAHVGEDNPILHAILLAHQARFTFLLGDVATAMAQLDQADLALSSARADRDAAQALILLYRGRTLVYQAYPSARDAFERSYALFEVRGDRWGMADALSGLGDSAVELGADYSLARRCLEQSLALYRELGNQLGQMEVLGTLSRAARYQGAIAESVALTYEAYTLARAVGNRRAIASAASDLGTARYYNDQAAEAYDLLCDALAIFLELGDRYQLAQVYFRLGFAEYCLGRLAAARASVTASLAAAHECQQPLQAAIDLSGWPSSLTRRRHTLKRASWPPKVSQSATRSASICI